MPGKIDFENIKKKIRKLVSEVSEIPESELRDDAEFGRELEVDSMMALEIVAKIEKEYKVVIPEEDIPKEAIRPKRDRGYHLSQCQAFTLTRRNRETIAMLKEDNWCWAPLIAFGLVETPEMFLDGNIFYPNLVLPLVVKKQIP